MTKTILPEDIEFLNSITSKLESGLKLYSSDFLYPWEISLTRHAALNTDFKIAEWGGYKNAFRKKIVCSQNKIKQSMFNITPVEFKPDSWILYASRKAVLDAFLKKGVSSELLGDIHKSDEFWILMLDSKFTNIEFDDVEIITSTNFPLDSINPPKEKISGTTSSVRLDSLCSIAFKPSRGKLKGLIENGGAMVDYNFATKAGREIKEGSVISLRGFPRFKLSEIGAVTKKGRTRVSLELLD